MGKRVKKNQKNWMALAKGVGVSLGVYLAGILLLALLMVKGTVSEGAGTSVLAALCLLACFAGGLLSVRGVPATALPGALAHTAVFAFALLVLGLGCWQEGVAWQGSGGVLLACALAGGILVAATAGKGKRRRKRP